MNNCGIFLLIIVVSVKYYLKRKKFVIEMKSKEGASCRQA